MQENKDIFTSKTSRFPHFEVAARGYSKMAHNDLNTTEYKDQWHIAWKCLTSLLGFILV